MTTDFEADIVRPITASDPTTDRVAAFSALYRTHRDDIARLCTSILHDRSEAEDATEEAFVRTWRAILDDRPEAYRYPWVRCVARNHCYDVLRKRKHTELTDGATLERIAPPVEGSDRGIEPGVDAALVRASVLRVSKTHRSILALRERDQLSYEEIAAREDVSVSTVESRLYRARRALRHEFLALSGREGLLGALGFRFRSRWFSGRASIAQFVGVANERVGGTGIGRVGAVTTVVATTAVSAIAAFSPTHAVSPRTTASPRSTAAAVSAEVAHPTTTMGSGAPRQVTPPRLTSTGIGTTGNIRFRTNSPGAIADAGQALTTTAFSDPVAPATATTTGTPPVVPSPTSTPAVTATPSAPPTDPSTATGSASSSSPPNVTKTSTAASGSVVSSVTGSGSIGVPTTTRSVGSSTVSLPTGIVSSTTSEVSIGAPAASMLPAVQGYGSSASVSTPAQSVGSIGSPNQASSSVAVTNVQTGGIGANLQTTTSDLVSAATTAVASANGGGFGVSQTSEYTTSSPVTQASTSLGVPQSGSGAGIGAPGATSASSDGSGSSGNGSGWRSWGR